MSVYEPSPTKNYQGDNKEKFIKWLRKHINEQITGRLIQHAEEEL